MMRLYKYAKCATCNKRAEDEYFIDNLLLDQLKDQKQRDEFIKREGRTHTEGLFLFLLDGGWDLDSDGLLKCPNCLRGEKVFVKPQTLTEALAQDARELDDILTRVEQRDQYKGDNTPLGYSVVEEKLRYVVQQFRHLQKVWKR